MVWKLICDSSRQWKPFFSKFICWRIKIRQTDAILPCVRFDVKTWWISSLWFCFHFQQNLYSLTIKILYSQRTNLYDCENRFFQKWFAEKWKSDEQGPFCRAYILTSKRIDKKNMNIALGFLSIKNNPWISLWIAKLLWDNNAKDQ